MKNRPFLEISKRIEKLSSKLESKIREKHEILLENSKLRKMIKSEIFNHQKAIDEFSEEMKRLDNGISSNNESMNPEKSLESSLSIQSKALGAKISLLKGEIAQKLDHLRKKQEKNRETESKLSVLLKEYNNLHKDFNEVVSSAQEEIPPISCEDPAEVAFLTEEVAKTRELLDFTQKKSLYLEAKLETLEKSRVSFDFLEKERHSLESSNRTLREKLSNRSGNSLLVENLRREVGVADEKRGRLGKNGSDAREYFKRLRKLHC